MNIRDLQYFLAVAELEHFGQAAEQCNVSQPTLSGQIKKLEESLGIVLLERTNRKVMLTEAGSHIATHARRIMREVDAIHDIAESARDPMAGKFRLGAFPTLSTYVFPKVVQTVTKAMPNLRLILIEEKTTFLIDKLKHGEIDAALLALPVDDDSLMSCPLFDDEFFLAISPNHELSKQTVIDQKILNKYRLLLLEEGHCLRDQALDVCQRHGIAEEQDFKATGLETLRQMVKAGTGITFMPKVAIQNNENDILYLPFSDPVPKRTIGLVWRKTTPKEIVMNTLANLIAG